MSCDHRREAAASRDLAEVGKPYLYSHSPTEGSRLLAPSHTSAAMASTSPSISSARLGRVEGGSGAGRFSRAIATTGRSSSPFAVPRDHTAGCPETLLKSQRFRPQIRPSDAVGSLLRGRPDAVKLGNRERCDKSGPIAGVTTNCPFGLRWLDASWRGTCCRRYRRVPCRFASSRMRARISFAVADAVCSHRKSCVTSR